MPDWQPEQHC